jgi:hypothetical protein
VCACAGITRSCFFERAKNAHARACACVPQLLYAMVIRWLRVQMGEDVRAACRRAWFRGVCARLHRDRACHARAQGAAGGSSAIETRLRVYVVVFVFVKMWTIINRVQVRRLWRVCACVCARVRACVRVCMWG